MRELWTLLADYVQYSLIPPGGVLSLSVFSVDLHNGRSAL